MPEFRVAVKKILIDYYLVDADSAEDAVARFQAGEGEIVDSEVEEMDETPEAELRE
jgi:hypothetical protein